jgi:ribosomal protein L37AE/L43A
MNKEICPFCGQRDVETTTENGVTIYICRACDRRWGGRSKPRHDHNPGKDRQRAERERDGRR